MHSLLEKQHRRDWKGKGRTLAALSYHVAKRQRWRCLWSGLWLTLVCVLAIDIYTRIRLYAADRETCKTKSEAANVDFQPSFKKRLHDLLELNRSEIMNCPHFVLAINKLLSQLFPRGALSTDALIQTGSKSEADTCGEEYNRTLHGYPWYKTGFSESSNCTRHKKLPISRLVSIVLQQCFLDFNKTVDLLESIRAYDKGIPIILGTMASMKIRLKLEWMFSDLKTIECDGYAGEILNHMIHNVDTPYSLVARDIFYFDDLSRLERQIYVISSTSVVGVVGGAFRNETGFWKVGCFQSRIRNYVLKYTPGYKYSALDCMLCDYLEGPFIMKTSIVQRYRFRSGVFAQVLFEDWFLQLKQANILVMNCPDVLYFKRGYVEGFPENEKNQQFESWLSLARRWEVDRIDFPSRGTLDFTCEQLGFTCDETPSIILPSCCLRKYTDLMRTIDDFAKQMNVEYEIIDGTVLGAVKLGNILPWDLDGDISFNNAEYDKFFNNSEYFRKRRLSVTFDKRKKYFKLFTGKIYFEMLGDSGLSKYKWPSSMAGISTRIKVNGLWMKGVVNPGLYARDSFGPDQYKHAPHWTHSGMKSSWDLYTPGSWPPCRRSFYHGCLDQYPTDGSEEILPDHLIEGSSA